MDPLTILEKRVQNLDSIINGYGFDPDQELEPDQEQEHQPSDSLIRDINKVSSVLSTIGSVHEKINEFNNRLHELNRYLNPQYVADITDAKTKSAYIMANEASIRQHCEYMQLCHQKSEVLNSDALMKIPPLMGEVEKLKMLNLEHKDQCDQIEKCVQQAMETYNTVSMSIMENLASLNNKIEAFERMKA